MPTTAAVQMVSQCLALQACTEVILYVLCGLAPRIYHYKSLLGIVVFAAKCCNAIDTVTALNIAPYTICPGLISLCREDVVYCH